MTGRPTGFTNQADTEQERKGRDREFPGVREEGVAVYGNDTWEGHCWGRKEEALGRGVSGDTGEAFLASRW